MYPLLASNRELNDARYPLGMVVRGQKAQTSFESCFNDAQIATVVNCIRTQFGCHFTDRATAAQALASNHPRGGSFPSQVSAWTSVNGRR